MNLKRVTGMLGVAVILGLAAGAGCSGCGGQSKRLDGVGSSFVEPMMREWKSLYENESGVEISYEPNGSGAGISSMTSGEAAFGCSDAPMNDEQLETARKEGGEVLHIPLVMGGIVPAYNLPDVPDLVFSGQVLLDIYLGKITKWNHDDIKNLNPKVADKLPNKKISVVFRSDSSGSTHILTDYFTKVNKEAWTPGRGTAIKFPVGIGAKGNPGVTAAVKQTEGTIGYVELIYALSEKIPYGAVLNKEGKAIKANTKSVTAAAAEAKIPDDLRYSITNSPGKEAYPIAGTVWALVYVKQSAKKGKQLKEFLHWITHEGQKHAEKLHYAPLPDKVIKMIEKKLAMIETGK